MPGDPGWVFFMQLTKDEAQLRPRRINRPDSWFQRLGYCTHFQTSIEHMFVERMFDTLLEEKHFV